MPDPIEQNILNAIMDERNAGDLDSQTVTFDSETGAPQQQQDIILNQEFAKAATDMSAVAPKTGLALSGMD